MRRALRRLGLCAVALLSAACAGSPSASPPPASAPAAGGTVVPPTTALPVPAGGFDIQAFEVAAAEDAPEAFRRVRERVGAALDRYLEHAVLAPLRSGQPAGDLSGLFTGAAAARVAGPDRGALVDEGLPPVSDVDVEKATASVLVLAGRGGEAGFATARIALLVRGLVGVAPLTVERTGELTLSPDGDTWKISGYEVRASKDTREESATGA